MNNRLTNSEQEYKVETLQITQCQSAMIVRETLRLDVWHESYLRCFEMRQTTTAREASRLNQVVVNKSIMVSGSC